MKLKKSTGSEMNKKASEMNEKAMEKMDEAREELAKQIRPGRSKKQTFGMVVGVVVAIAALAFAIMTLGGSSEDTSLGGSSEESW